MSRLSGFENLPRISAHMTLRVNMAAAKDEVGKARIGVMKDALKDALISRAVYAPISVFALVVNVAIFRCADSDHIVLGEVHGVIKKTPAARRLRFADHINEGHMYLSLIHI